MTHDINADPEMWELREKFGDRAGFVWLECLAIADRNGGKVGPSSPQLHAVLASKCRVYSPKVRAILGWCLGTGWLVDRDGLYIAKWAKYNKTRETKKLPSYPNPPNPPNPPKEDAEPATPAPSADSLKSTPAPQRLLDPCIKAVADRIYFSDRKKFARLIVWIKEAQRERFSDDLIAAALLRFERYAATADPWYPYLDKIIYKLYGDKNARESEAQSEQYKQELADYAQDLKH